MPGLLLPTHPPSSKLVTSVKHSKSALRSWNKTVFGNIQSSINSLHSLIDSCQSFTQDSQTLKKEKELQNELDELLKREQLMGLRHGCPISAALFAIYFDLLSRMITRVEKENNIHGIKVCRTSPSISHLMYADDLTIFCGAELVEAANVQSVTNEFYN
ncbi:hypothetical protein M9H77_09614 [Catharanthus roseus]|uniref:Uncharacterized protein n=1 Tax=Catharanthus roseus TaxID=4058 RepID=A0ACC0C138_CATRO|nr:hypothetical protein M9H77_09614 [Catharanthus roseus]